VDLDNVVIPVDKLIRSRRKTIALVVERDGSLVVHAPMRTNEETINKFVAEKERWIRKKQDQARTFYPPFVPKEYVDGEGFLYLGAIYRLQIGQNKKPPLTLNGTFRLTQASLPKAPLVFEHWYRKQALQVISERVQFYAEKYGIHYKQVRITSARTRWGSCSQEGTLSFAWRLIMAPLPIIDYVVVHELSHVQVKNHSKRFWNKLNVLMSDYRQRIEWLERNGHLLSLE
jgi:predicted metal-dependent hydrolase